MSVAVGRGGLQNGLAVIRHMEINAVEIIARLFGRDGEARLVDDLLERFGGQFEAGRQVAFGDRREVVAGKGRQVEAGADRLRSEEHTSELQSLMRISYAVF